MLTAVVDVIGFSAKGESGQELCLETRDIVLILISPKPQRMDSENCQLINLGVSEARKGLSRTKVRKETGHATFQKGLLDRWCVTSEILQCTEANAFTYRAVIQIDPKSLELWAKTCWNN